MNCSEFDIGKKITELRKARGLSQEELACALHVSREVVAKWENGTRDLKTGHTIALAQFFGITCDELLQGVKAENVEVSREIGLSDAAINALIKKCAEAKRDNEQGWIDTYPKQELKVINFLLEHDHQVLNYIYQYLFGAYDSFMIIGDAQTADREDIVSSDILLCSRDKLDSGIIMNARQVQSAFMLSIQEGLMDLRDMAYPVNSVNINKPQKRVKKSRKLDNA